jgi:N-acyl-D-amino-acid deacylase
LKEEGPEDKQDQSEYYRSENFEKLRDRAKTDGKRMSTNLVQLVGHNEIRHGVAGLGGRPCNEEENKLSAHILEENIEQGAWGLSLGLEYMPGVFADFNELKELGEVCYKRGTIITSHMRNEGDKVFQSFDEMVRLSRETGARVHISQLKICSKEYWGQAEKLFETIEKANREGASVTADMYPYSACSTGIMNTLPDWAKEGGAEKAAKRICTAGVERDRLYAYFNQRFTAKDDGDRIYIMGTIPSHIPCHN